MGARDGKRTVVENDLTHKDALKLQDQPNTPPATIDEAAQIAYDTVLRRTGDDVDLADIIRRGVHDAYRVGQVRSARPLPLSEIFGSASEILRRRISDVWTHGRKAGREEDLDEMQDRIDELETDRDRRCAYTEKRVEWARAAEAKEWQDRLAEELQARDAEIRELETRITELETDLDLACFHRDTDHVAAIRSLEDRLDRARRHASFLRGELYRERTRRETAQDYRNAATRHAIAEILAAKAPTRTIAEEWADEVMAAINAALPDTEEGDRG